MRLGRAGLSSTGEILNTLGGLAGWLALRGGAARKLEEY